MRGAPHSPARLLTLRDPFCCGKNWDPEKPGGQVRRFLGGWTQEKLYGLERRLQDAWEDCHLCKPWMNNLTRQRHGRSPSGLFHTWLRPGGVCTCGLSRQELVLSGPKLFFLKLPENPCLSVSTALVTSFQLARAPPSKRPLRWVSSEYLAWCPQSWEGPWWCRCAPKWHLTFLKKGMEICIRSLGELTEVVISLF